MTAYYNEIDPRAAAWLRNLIADGLISPGDVDERSIEDVRPTELAGYTQCHFFAGIGGWALALDLAGWPRDKPVWTGSCPCQPFSSAGKGAGANDERHLWPAWQHLIAQRAPPVIFGEQVASAINHGWLDLVSADLEGQGYAVGAAVLGAHSVGSPHIRQRLWFVGDREQSRLEGHARNGGTKGGRTQPSRSVAATGVPRQVGNPDSAGREPWQSTSTAPRHGSTAQSAGSGVRPSALHGGWHAADWIRCRDDKWRPVEPGTFPLVDGVSGRVGLLRGYGNAIVPQVAAEFIRAYADRGVVA